jgi:hypothetical protein
MHNLVSPCHRVVPEAEQVVRHTETSVPTLAHNLSRSRITSDVMNAVVLQRKKAARRPGLRPDCEPSQNMPDVLSPDAYVTESRSPRMSPAASAPCAAAR